MYCIGYCRNYRFLVVSKLYPRVQRYKLSVSPVPLAGLLLYRVVTWKPLTNPSQILNRTPLSIVMKKSDEFWREGKISLNGTA